VTHLMRCVNLFPLPKQSSKYESLFITLTFLVTVRQQLSSWWRKTTA